jgi:hypothetical protein
MARRKQPRDDNRAGIAWSSPGDGSITLSFEANWAADHYLRQTARNEPAVTADMRSVARATEALLQGLEQRLKSADSFKLKLAGYLDGFDGDIRQALADMKDPLRYSLVWPTGQYVRGVQSAIELMRKRGFECVKWRNAWPGRGYCGINSSWRDHVHRQVFEVQLHTPESYAARNRSHATYEVMRLLMPGDFRLDRLLGQQEQIFNAVPRPLGADRL